LSPFLSDVLPRRFFGKLLTFCFVIGALDLGVGIVLDHLYQGTQGGGVGVINRALKQRQEVVVIGDSRAHHHFDPAVLGQETGLGVYNAGVDGQSLLFFYALEQLIVTEYSPKLILLHLGPGDLRGRQEALDRLSVLLPHAHHPEIRALLMQRSPYENIKLLSRIYPYNSMIAGLLAAAVLPVPSSDYNGYVALRGSDMPATLSAVATADPYEAEQGPASRHDDRQDIFLRTLRRFITSARVRGIATVICVSPRWGEQPLDRPVRQLIDAEKAQYIEITQVTHPVFRDPMLFKDPSHLNERGARVFSQILGEELRKRLALRGGGPAVTYHDDHEQARRSGARFPGASRLATMEDRAEAEAAGQP
jgi:hypothetical protein